MLMMGDELGRTQYGNNNAYCHDNELNWLDWAPWQADDELWRFVKHCIAFRQAHRMLRSRHYVSHDGEPMNGFAAISWHGCRAGRPDWSYDSRSLAFLLRGQGSPADAADAFIYVAMNMYWEPLEFELPKLPVGIRWHAFANTGQAPPADICRPGEELLLLNQRELPLRERAVAILVGRRSLPPA